MSKRNLLVIALQMLFLLFIIFSHYSVVLLGEEITLKTRPVDPYDIFRGAYVTLSYEEESIHSEKVDISDEVKYGDYVYVSFTKVGDFHEVQQLTEHPPINKPYLKVKYLYPDGFHHRVSFKLNRYYTNEKEALDLEQKVEKLLVHIKVKNGRGVITGISEENE